MNSDNHLCSRCVMDNSDPDIFFDSKGICKHCQEYDRRASLFLKTGQEAKNHVDRLVQRMADGGRKKDYDCVIGMSGGVDSSFVAYKLKQFGLRPFAVHLDNGWNSEVAVQNIERLLKTMQWQLQTYVLDWEEFKDLQLAFLKASTPDAEIPTDHAIVAVLNQVAQQMNIPFIVSGYNVKTETHIPAAWSQGHGDWKYITSVHRRFGTKPLKTFPHANYFDGWRYRFNHEWIDLLNFVDYNKKDAMKILHTECGWNPYGCKHYESIYTRFIQGYVLPQKFGYDKRKSHYSSLICSGEMTRGEALELLKEPPYAKELQTQDREYVLRKLGLTAREFDRLMNQSVRSIYDFPSYASFAANPIIQVCVRLKRLIWK